MREGPVIELDVLVVPGADADAGARIAAAFRRELGRLWEADGAEGIGWAGDFGDLTLDLDPTLAQDALGRAIAREVRRRACFPGETR